MIFTFALREVADAFSLPAKKRVVSVYESAVNMVLCAEMLQEEVSQERVRGMCFVGNTLQLCSTVVLKRDPVCCTLAAGR